VKDMAEDGLNAEIKMDPQALYREEVFTDRRIGTIQRLTLVDGDGQPVNGGPVIYLGQTQLMTPAGALPLSFELQADSLAEAAEKFGDGANIAMEEAVKRLEELRREQASSIIVPGARGNRSDGGFNL
jgi:hypothetical protein